MKTAQEFEAAVGYPPQDDDLERTNCDKVGNITHSCCGWCGEHNKPRFICGCILVNYQWMYVD